MHHHLQDGLVDLVGLLKDLFDAFVELFGLLFGEQRGDVKRVGLVDYRAVGLERIEHTLAQLGRVDFKNAYTQQQQKQETNEKTANE